jgi:DNA invertase Pin-like site-specific DNA recombinase
MAMAPFHFQQRYRNSLKICDFWECPMNRRKLHEQARRAIERLIADRGIKAGSQIPGESRLAGELYVSRTTIRRALKWRRRVKSSTGPAE